MTATLRQQTSAPSGTATWPSNTVTGNCLVACLHAYGASSIGAVTSASSADTWRSLVAVPGAGQVIAVWMAPATSGGAATANFTASGATQQNIQCYELAGMGASPTVDVSVTHLDSTSPNTSAWSTGATASAGASDVRIGMLAGTTSSLLSVNGAGSPWNSQSSSGSRVSGNYAVMVSGYYIPGSSGSVTYTATASTNGALWAGIALAITPGSAGGAGSGSFLPFFT